MKAFKYGILLIFMIVTTYSIFSGYRYDMTNIYDQENLIAEDTDTFDLEIRSEDIENKTYTADYRIDGYGLIWTYNSDKDEEITVPYTLNVASGKAKLVLIDEENNVTTLIENNNKAEKLKMAKLRVKIKKGLNRIKIVGYKADVEIKMRMSKGEFSTLGLY